MNRDLIADPTFLRVIDVGASGGPQSRWKEADYKSLIVLFEPDPRESEILQKKLGDRYIVRNVALSERPGNLEFHMYRDQLASSVYLPDLDLLRRYYIDKTSSDYIDDRYDNLRTLKIDKFDVLKTITLSADTLDNQLSIVNLMDIDFIKLDVQGHELPILKGGRTTLSNTVGVEIEVEFLPLYKGQSVFHEVDSFLTSCGFELYDLKRTFRNRCGKKIYGDRKGQLLWADALYLRSPERLLQEIKISSHKVLRSARIYLAYHYPDLASTLLDLATVGSHINSCDAKVLNKLLAEYEVQKMNIIPKFPGKRRLRALCLRLAEILTNKRRTDKWEDKALGNSTK